MTGIGAGGLLVAVMTPLASGAGVSSIAGLALTTPRVSPGPADAYPASARSAALSHSTFLFGS
jgi:hypothetical protein